MNQQIKADWLAELASGNWRCGTGWLRTHPHQFGLEPTYSPLGVLCELYMRAGHTLELRLEDSEWDPNQFVIAYDGEILKLPYFVAQWAEMDALPWMKLDKPSGIFNLAYISKLGGFALAITAIKKHL